VVARAWTDPGFKARLLTDAAGAAMELGISAVSNTAPTVLTVVENTAAVHNLVVCTLCSCYPRAILGQAQGLTLVHFQLNLSRFSSLTPPTDTEYPTKSAYIEPKSGRLEAPGEVIYPPTRSRIRAPRHSHGVHSTPYTSENWSGVALLSIQPTLSTRSGMLSCSPACVEACGHARHITQATVVIYLSHRPVW
jgi:hypothetical protein